MSRPAKRSLGIAVLLLGQLASRAFAASLKAVVLPESAERGSVVTGLVELDGPAPAEAAVVELSSGEPLLARLVSPTVTVPAGASSATFLLKTAPGGGTLKTTISAMYQGVTVEALLRLPPLSPVRGLPRDPWADVVLGKPGFGEMTPNLVTASRLFNPGGALVDRSVNPNRLYVYDGGNSRVLGYSHLGNCESGGAPCTTSADCGGGRCGIMPGHCRSAPGQACFSGPDCPDGTCVIDEGTLPADLVLGQPDAASSACNGDGNFQTYPVRAPASASSLCTMPVDQVSPAEGGSFANMAVDAAGNLYVPDWDNNRVLRYDSPFTTDRQADFVWGQTDFTGNECNRGETQPDEQSLCLRNPLNEGFTGGVGLGPDGSLWVCDNRNNRVLRFPSPAGIPSPVADLVLGQPDFASSEKGSDLQHMWSPQAVRVDPAGTVYIVDSQPGGGSDSGGRVLVFTPPFRNGMAASGTIGAGTLRNPTGIEFDPATGGLWINDTGNNQLQLYAAPRTVVLFKDVPDDSGACGGDYSGDGPLLSYAADGQVIDSSNICGAYGGIGIDGDGNVFVAASSFVQDTWRFKAPFPDPARGTAHSADKRVSVPNQFGMFNHVGAAGLYSPRGVAVAEPPGGVPQLIVADVGRLLFWNDPPSLSDGQAADGWTGAFDLEGRPTPGFHASPDFGRIRADRAQPPHLWVLRGDQILVYALPLTTGALPVAGLGSGIPVAGNAGTVTWDGLLPIGGLAVNANGTELWVADPNRHRVFRIRNPLGTGRQVDVILGQADATETSCNRGQPSPGRNTLCNPGSVALDPSGNVYVSDSALEGVGNFRMLEWDAARFEAPGLILGPDADRVFGTGGSFSISGCQDPMCAPWEPAFASSGAMVVGLNPYLATSRFPLVYRTPLTTQDPDTYLDDYWSQPYAATFDRRDNLYMADLNRGRVLVFRDPLGLAPAGPRGVPEPVAPRDTPRTVSRGD